MSGKRASLLDLAPELREVIAQVHFEPTAFRSPITGRTIYVNLHEHATAVLPSFTTAGLAAARADWDARLAESRAHVAARNAQLPPHKRGGGHIGGLSDDLIRLADTVLGAPTRADFADGARALLARWLNPPRVYGKARVMGGAALRCMELVVLLWKHELIALPAGHVWRPTPFNMHTFPERTERWYGGRVVLLHQLLDGQRNESVAPITRFFLACGGLRESGDVTAEVFDALQPHTGPGLRTRRRPRSKHRPGDADPLVPRHQLYCVGDRFQALQRHDYERDPVAFAKVPQSYRENLYPKRHERSDPEFKWAASAGPRLEPWRAAVAEYVGSRRGVVNVAAFISRGNLLLDYVVATADVPADPLDFCRRDYTPSRGPLPYFEEVLGSDTSTYYVRAARETAKFFAWLLAARALDADRHVRPEYRNPVPAVDLPSERARNGQTYRNAIPLRFLRMLREIIEEDDFAWPRSLVGDYFRWRDPETGEWSREWSPVRAYFYLLRLALPLRGFQVRMLDSGEGDPECYRPGAGADGSDWVPNVGRHAPVAGTRTRPPQGFVRRVYDRDAGAWDTGLYVNTNKSGDRAAAWESVGYDIPWAPADVLEIFTRLRDFQERYNPAMRALKRSDLQQSAGLHRTAPDVAKRLVPTYFLFRDPCNRRHPQEPVTDSRALRFWALLWGELERRLEASGMLAPDGRPYRFIRSRDDSGVPHVVEYDGHSLRVSGLTHFLDAGVPVHILSAFVAGHASVIMTYHYIRPRRGQVRDALEAARARLAQEDAESADFAAFQRDVPLEVLQDLVVCNDDDAVARLKESGAGQAVWMQGGICPAGGGLCHEGGPVVRAAVGAVRAAYAPVPGGARNCPLCRFYITGPAWLPALYARYNEVVFRLHEEVAALRDAEQRANDLAKPYGGGAFDAERWRDHRLRHAEDAVDRQDEQVGVTLHTLARLQLLIQRAEQIKAERRAQPEGLRPNALVLGGQAEDCEYALRATSAFQLVNGICESSDLYPDIDAKLPAIRRGQLYDRMLEANGLPTIFSTMSDRELKEAGDALARLMYSTLGEDDTEAVMAGRLYLRDTGLTLDLTSILSAGAGARPVRVALPVVGPISLGRGGGALSSGLAAPEDAA